MSAFIQGFGLGASLIIAIGSQNAYVLRQGLKRQHVLLICLLCALSDALLITVGVAGLGALVSGSEILLTLVRILGALFLSAYSLKAGFAAFKGEYQTPGVGTSEHGSVKTVVFTTLAFTFLNPHVYLDTVVLLGSFAGQFASDARTFFGIGAVAASFVWFFVLGYGASWLAPMFQRAQAWRLLDAIISLIMLSLAISLVIPLL